MERVEEELCRLPVLMKILVVDDDESVGNTLVSVLERAGMRAAWAQNGAEALVTKAHFAPDVVLLDLHLPDVDGLALLRQFVRDATCGVIVISGMNDEADRIVGLEMGADDYISKPPCLRELLARVRAVHRRVTSRHVIKESPFSPFVSPALSIGSVKVNVTTRTVCLANGDEVTLTSAELAVFRALWENIGKPVSRDRLSAAALYKPWRPEDRSVDQLIFNLRNKLGYDHTMIHSVRGQGYVLMGHPAGESSRQEAEEQSIRL